MSIRCAEIYFSNSGNFTFTCTLCKANFFKAIIIAEHLIDNHFFSIYPDALKSPFLIADNELATIRELFASKKDISLSESTGVIENEILENIELEYEKINTANDVLETKDLEVIPTEKETHITVNDDNLNIINSNSKVSIPNINDKIETESNNRTKMLHQNNLLKSGNIPNTDTWKCHICEVVIRKRSRPRHMKMHQRSDLKYNCICCDKSFMTQMELQDHIKVHSCGPVDRPFQCFKCDNKYKILPNLKEHIKRAHLKLRDFKCNFCEKRYYSEKEAKRHEIANHSQPKPFICELCGVACTTNQQFKNHKRRHAEPTFQCNQCDKKFHIKRTLVLHQIVHNNHKPHVCKVCFARFPRQASYRCHMKLHSDVKDYICKICGKDFAQPSGIRGHMKSHGIVYTAINVIRKSENINQNKSPE